VLAIGMGGYLFYWLTKVGRIPPPPEPERNCTRCKLRVVGKSTEAYLFCPFCAAKY